MKIELIKSDLGTTDVSAPDVLSIRVTLPNGLIVEIDAAGEGVSVARRDGRELLVAPVATNTIRITGGEK